jgi:hypothetical protein
MNGNQKLAEICLEYLNNDMISSRAVVMYVGKGGGAEYSDGFVAYLVDENGNPTGSQNGGKAIFNRDDNTLDYLAGTAEPIFHLYLSAYGIMTDEQEGAVHITPEPYYVRDASDNSYPVVKIGCEVWLGSNLRTTEYGNGTPIDLISWDAIAQYKNDTPFATYPRNDPNIDTEVFGYLYNARTLTGDNDVYLGETIVDGNWRIATGGGSTAAGVMGSDTDWQRLFKYVGRDQLGAILAKGHSWNNGGAGQFDLATLTDITGLSIPAAGEIYSIHAGYFLIGTSSQAFFFYGGGSGAGYNLAERDGRAADQAGVRTWNHANDACSIRLVRIDQ